MAVRSAGASEGPAPGPSWEILPPTQKPRKVLKTGGQIGAYPRSLWFGSKPQRAVQAPLKLKAFQSLNLRRQSKIYILLCFVSCSLTSMCH